MRDQDPRSGDERVAERELDRRQFLQSMGAVAVGGVLADLGLFDQMGGASAAARRTPPNILVLLVDELRFPTVFPEGTATPAQFLQRFMPNLYELWRHGVKFTSHHTAGNACSPARAAIATGLYPHQEWLLATRTAAGPSLQTAFPTYGKLLRGLGYHTPYVGKWHLSNAPSDGSTAGYLDDYGFDGMTNPDPLGQNGEGEAKDPGIADQAVSWLQGQGRSQQPYCLTVSFVNPHDRQFFWGGSEGTSHESLFAGQPLQPFISDYASVSGEDAPPPIGYPAVPPNWESGATLQQGKPQSQTLFRTFQQLVWGAASDDVGASDFAVVPSPAQPDRLGLGVAPFGYWSRGLDMYTYVMTLVDAQLGRVVAGVPSDQMRNTVIVFASDHGEYSGAHGFLSGKLGTAYDEAWHIPMIVADPSGRFTAETDAPRAQLTSSVDFMPLLVSLGNGGSRSWMRGPLREIYGRRLDLVPLLRNPRARGRDHLLFATDEIVPVTLNYLRLLHARRTRRDDEHAGRFAGGGSREEAVRRVRAAGDGAAAADARAAPRRAPRPRELSRVRRADQRVQRLAARRRAEAEDGARLRPAHVNVPGGWRRGFARPVQGHSTSVLPFRCTSCGTANDQAARCAACGSATFTLTPEAAQIGVGAGPPGPPASVISLEAVRRRRGADRRPRRRRRAGTVVPDR